MFVDQTVVYSMFEVPITYNCRRLNVERRVRYQYINILSRKYHAKRRSKRRRQANSLPTPENSAVENDQSESQLPSREQIKEKKMKLGEDYSDSEAETSSEGEDTTKDDNEFANDMNKFEKLFYRKYEKPEHSFEVWYDGNSVNTKKKHELKKTHIHYTRLNRVERIAKKRVEKNVVHMPLVNKRYFDIKSEGYEVLEPLVDIDSYLLKHIEILTQILFSSVSQGNWDIAYRTFSLLIRIPEVDIRNIWGLGTRILMERGQTTRSLEFLKWMSTVYSSKQNFVQSHYHRKAPVFRSGSRTHTPKYALTWLWNCLIKVTELISIEEEKGVNTNEEENDNGSKQSAMDKLTELIDKISEMVLVPPYLDDPEIWFIYSMCHMVHADYLSGKFNCQRLSGSRRDIARNQVTQHIHYVKTYLQNCSQKGNFEYPKQFIQSRLEEFEKRMYEDESKPENMKLQESYDNTSYSNEDDEENPFQIDESNSFLGNLIEEGIDPVIKTHWEPTMNMDALKFNYNSTDDSSE